PACGALRVLDALQRIKQQLPDRPHCAPRITTELPMSFSFRCRTPLWGDVSDQSRDPSLVKSPGLRHPACGALRVLDALQRIKQQPPDRPHCAPGITTDAHDFLVFVVEPRCGAMSVTRNKQFAMGDQQKQMSRNPA
ncbi:MAG TPA: hypothetical protein PLY64_10285, partial [Dokdonella sp.]|nr:hypothetical protein [Dokdonella sp.]